MMPCVHETSTSRRPTGRTRQLKAIYVMTNSLSAYRMNMPLDRILGWTGVIRRPWPKESPVATPTLASNAGDPSDSCIGKRCFEITWESSIAPFPPDS